MIEANVSQQIVHKGCFGRRFAIGICKHIKQQILKKMSLIEEIVNDARDS